MVDAATFAKLVHVILFSLRLGHLRGRETMQSKILAAAACAALFLSACGGGGDDTPVPTTLAGLDTSGPVGKMILAEDQQFCFGHEGVRSHRFMENLNAVAHPEIIQTTFQAEVTCNDDLSAVKTFVIATGEMIS